MDLSIIIAHYDPGQSPACVAAFHKVLQTIRQQQNELEIELIIADDGSPTHAELPALKTRLLPDNDRKIYHLSGDTLSKWLSDRDFPQPWPAHWLYLPKANHGMCKARLWNHATQLARSDTLLFLDDDNYFTSKNTLQKLLELMQSYDVLFGQITDSNGRVRAFSSHRVQGTSFAIHRHLLQDIGGFGIWTEQVSSGIDSDFWWKLYRHYQTVRPFPAAYSSALSTVDSCSKRWRPFTGSFFRHRAVRRLFYQENGCRNYRSVKDNPARDKSLWMTNLT
jgi:glycosyltransferase involved in cell wall biosynthesis